MTETIDLASVNKVMKKTLEESEEAKSHCRKPIIRQEKDTKIIDGQAKEIKTLPENQDPQQIRALIDMTAKAEASLGMEDIRKYMSSFKET